METESKSLFTKYSSSIEKVRSLFFENATAANGIDLFEDVCDQEFNVKSVSLSFSSCLSLPPSLLTLLDMRAGATVLPSISTLTFVI